MIREEICTYEVCKLAKKKGFNEPTDHYYHIYDDVIEAQNSLEMTGDGCADFYNSLNRCRCAAPTQSQLQGWLRDNHEVDVWVETAATMATKNQRCYYWHIAYESDGCCIYVLDSMLSYPTYEKALEEGLKEALIEFVEERK